VKRRLCGISCAQSLKRPQTGFHPKRGDHSQQFLTQPAVHRSPSKAAAILPTVAVMTSSSVLVS
jgi:hypothetical protein